MNIISFKQAHSIIIYTTEKNIQFFFNKQLCFDFASSTRYSELAYEDNLCSVPCSYNYKKQHNAAIDATTMNR